MIASFLGIYIIFLTKAVEEITVLCLVIQLCTTLCHPMDCTACQAPLSIGILQARLLEWVAMPTSRGSSQPRDQASIFYVPCIGKQALYQ